MKEPICKYMKVGQILSMAFPSTGSGEGPILEAVKKIVTDDYFQAIEITWIKDRKVREQVRAILEASAITVSYVSHPRLLSQGLNINDLHPERRKQAVETLKEGIVEAYKMGAESYSVLSGAYQEDKKGEAYLALTESLKELSAYATEQGKALGKERLRLELEVFDYDIDKKSLIGPAPLARRLAEEMRREDETFGLVVDQGHIPLLRETFREAVVPVKEFLTHVHIGNCVLKDPALPGYGDQHPRFAFPNGENGLAELVEFLQLLLDIGYLNTEKPPIVSFEVKPFGEEDPEVIIANSKRFLNEAWARL